MSAIVAPDEEECFLLAILESADGLDLAEFCWFDSESSDGCYRAWDFQWPWYTCDDRYQIDQGGRATGKSVSIMMRCFAFPFAYPGQRMLLTAPELNHLSLLTGPIESRFLNTRLMKEMLPKGKGNGIRKQPHWECTFRNQTVLVSRLPNKDGKGVKGNHVLQIELDEAQDYPHAGWVEIADCLNTHLPDSRWRCHGVPRGVRDDFYEKTEGSDEDRQWTLHRPMAMNRPSWSDAERQDKIKQNGGSRQNTDYKRNIYGLHGDTTNSVFVLARLMDCVDTDAGSTYNTEVYANIRIEFERLPKPDPTMPQEEVNRIRQQVLLAFINLPGEHKSGYSQTVSSAGGGRAREVGAPKGYSAYWGGADIGVTNHPSEFLIFGQREGTDFLELLTRINLQRINTDDQMLVIQHLFEFYGPKLQAFTLDKSGVGQPIWDILSRHPLYAKRIFGYNFSEKVVVGFEDRELERGEEMIDIALKRNVIEAVTDYLRNDYVDQKKFRLPWDREILLEFQGQTYCCDDLVEVLTDRGWLRYDQMQPGDSAVGLNPDGTSDWTTVRAVHVFPAVPRQMLSMEHVKHSSLTTLDHRWYARRLGVNAPIEVVTSRELIPDLRPALRGSRWSGGRAAAQVLTDNRWRIPIAAAFQGAPKMPKYDDDFVELVAWFYTEGHWRSGHLIGFSQSESANPDHVLRIETLLQRMFGEGTRNAGRGRRHGRDWSVTTGACNQYRVLNRDARRLMASVVDPEKVVAPEFIAALTRRQLELFIDVSLFGDGCEFDRKGRVREFIQKHDGRTASFEMACALAGKATRTRRRCDGTLVVTVSNERYTNSTSAKREVVEYDGVVWCPETDTGNFLARRNGTVYFTGNTTQSTDGTPYGTRRVFGGGSFHCVDEETEIMTADGWRRYDEIEVGQDVLTMDMIAQTSAWTSLQGVHVFPEGPSELISMESQSHSSLTTANHRWPARSYDPHTRTYGPMRFRTTSELSKTDAVPVAVPHVGFPSEAVHADEFVELVAWFWTEGNMTKSNTNITQSTKSEDNVAQIRRALEKTFGPAGYATFGRGHRAEHIGESDGVWHECWDLSRGVVQFQLRRAAGERLRRLCPNRVPTPAFLRDLTAEQLDLFIETSEKGDGNHAAGSKARAFQHLRDDAQARMIEMACALAGIATSTRTYVRPASRSGTSTTVTLLTGRRGGYARPGKFRTVSDASGLVWCPNTIHGTWLARRRGQVYWTGNTLDAAKMVMAGKHLPPIEAMLNMIPKRKPVLDLFVGA